MNINKIELLNFQSYYGNTELDFSNGLNLIIGRGGKGKSKLFNAFYWVLFGKIYITDEGWCSTNGLPSSSHNVLNRHEYINKRALYEANEGDIVKVSVTLDLTDDNGVTYIIERQATAERQKGEIFDSPLSWNVSQYSLRVSYDSLTGTVIKIDDLAEDIITNTLFPEGIRGYIWFQGESLADLINFRKKENLRDAVKHISYFPYYEKLAEIIVKSKSTIEKKERAHIREVNKHNDALKATMSDIEANTKFIETELANNEEIKNKIQVVEIALAEDETKLTGLASFTGLVSRYDNCEKDLLNARNLASNIDEEQRKLLPNSWILRGSGNLINKAKEIIASHVDSVCTAPERKYLDNPGKSKLEEILRDGKCFVCGSPVDENHQHAIDWIRERLRMQEEYYKEMEEYRSNLEFSKKFNMFIGKIQDYPDSVLRTVNSIDNQFQKTENDLEKIMVKVRQLQEKKRALDEEMLAAKKKHGIDPSRGAQNANIINTGIVASKRNLETLRRRYDASNTALAEYRAKLKVANSELAKLGSCGQTVTVVAETEWLRISEFLEDVCKHVKENARKELLKKIEKRANEFYKMFTEHDNGYTGTVDISDDYTIKFDPQLNTSHEDRKKMSIINALLSLNQEALDVSYPFISDAPTSSFDMPTTYSYLLGVKDIFNQTIIMTKDVEIGSSTYDELFNQKKVSRIYELNSSIIDGANESSPEIYEVCTLVKRLK